MRSSLGTYALMLSIILYGVLLGGVVYSHIVFFPVYLSHLPESAILTYGEYALHEENFWLLIHPLLVMSLIVSLAINWREALRRKLIAVTLGVYVLVLVVSSLYFIPRLGEFRESFGKGGSAAEWMARGSHWQHMSWIRGGTLFVFSIPLLFALTHPKRSDGNS
jgi:hypothetical protein